MQRPPPSSNTAVLRPPAPSASSSAGSSPATSEKALATWKALAAMSPLPDGTAPSAATDEGDEAEAVAEAAAKAASAAASKVAFRFRAVRPGEFEPQHHFYPRCLNAQIHPSVRFFMGLSRERLISRYTHLNPRVDPVELRRMLTYQPRYLRWAGCDLMHVVDSRTQSKSMVVIETNSCPSGQKSTPLFDDQDEYGGYRLLLQRALLSRLQSGDEPVVPGKLAVLFDKNPMEASGYAACLAELTDEEVLLVPMFDDAADAEEPVAEAVAGATRPHRRPVSFFRDGILYVRRPRPTSGGNGAAAIDTCNGNGRAGGGTDPGGAAVRDAASVEPHPHQHAHHHYQFGGVVPGRRPQQTGGRQSVRQRQRGADGVRAGDSHPAHHPRRAAAPPVQVGGAAGRFCGHQSALLQRRPGRVHHHVGRGVSPLLRGGIAAPEPLRQVHCTVADIQPRVVVARGRPVAPPRVRRTARPAVSRGHHAGQARPHLRERFAHDGERRHGRFRAGGVVCAAGARPAQQRAREQQLGTAGHQLVGEAGRGPLLVRVGAADADGQEGFQRAGTVAGRPDRCVCGDVSGGARDRYDGAVAVLGRQPRRRRRRGARRGPFQPVAVSVGVR
eukprot:ctg_4066.g445